jgi:hypothetical protein
MLVSSMLIGFTPLLWPRLSEMRMGGEWFLNVD